MKTKAANPGRGPAPVTITSRTSILLSLSLGWLASGMALAQPVITAQPADQLLAPGQSARFTTAARGSGPLSLQWFFDGTALAGATGYALFLTNAQSAQGYYSVVVSNAAGSVTSQVARLKVFPAVPLAHSFARLQLVGQGSASLTFSGETTLPFARYYSLYPVESSANLTDWSPLALLQRTNAEPVPLQFTDAAAPNSGPRFYRTPTNQLATPDPLPTGPYLVGTFSLLLTNAARTNAQFIVSVWYPATALAGVLPASYVDPQVALLGGYDLSSSGGGNFVSQVAAFVSHSVSNAPVAAGLAKYPVLLYDPAWGDHRQQNTDKAEDLASWGYVVVGPDTRDTTISVFPDGTVVHGQPVAYTTPAIDAEIEGRLSDLECVLDQLAGLNINHPVLAGRLDLDHIGVIGFSMGGSTAAQLCLRDPRCKAGVGMDWWYVETNVLTHPLGVPWLYFRSDDGPDPDPASTLPDGRPDDRLQVYNVQTTNAYWVKLVSTVHYSFDDWDLIADSASLAVRISRGHAVHEEMNSTSGRS
jgi:pimeloyl-ACP methyl ester carboxylesterase